MHDDESQIFTSAIQLFDVLSDVTRRSKCHANCPELLLCQPQECGASNLLFLQDPKVFIIQVFGILGLKVLDKLIRVPSFDVGDGRRLCGASKRL